MGGMGGLEAAVDELAAATGFAGAVRVDAGDEVWLAKAYGLAHRGLRIPNTADTRFAVASGGKGLTALAVVSLILDGRLDLSTPARSLLGGDLPLIGDEVTVEHLLAHRSGIGDHIDEEAGGLITDHVVPVPVHELDHTEQYLRVLDGHPPKFGAGERFSYCNSGYVVLALLAERAGGTPFHDLVGQRVCTPAGMHDTDFLRSDEPGPRTALGYLGSEGLRTNVLHLPVRGGGDGGIYSTVADLHALWTAFWSGRIVPPEWVAAMVRPRSRASEDGMRYGLGFWLHPSSQVVMLEGYDAGVSFRSAHDPARLLTATVVSNSSEGAWPLARLLAQAGLPGTPAAFGAC